MLKNKKYSEFPHVSHEHMEVFLKCFTICSSCAQMCIKENMTDIAILCGECADICALNIKWHSANSTFTDEISKLCSEVCLRCAEACAQSDRTHCQQCSEICYECAEACKK